MSKRFLFFLLLPVVLQAQQLPSPTQATLYAPDKAEGHTYTLAPSAVFTDPPTSPVRTPAEWEEQQAVLIAWISQPVILSKIVKSLRTGCQVIICCNSQSVVNSATTYLTNANIDISSNVTFAIIPYDSIWIRDYGPNSVYTNDVDSLILVDWIYNRNRPKDDALANGAAILLNVPLYKTLIAPTDLVNTGGNFMSDGFGKAFASNLVLTENGPDNFFGQSNHSEAEVDAIMQQYMGIDNYLKMIALPYDDIHHIDMHMKLLDEETLLVGEYPAGVSDGPQIEANIQYALSNMTTRFGTPFKVIRMIQPPDFDGTFPNANGDYRTYTNSLISNKTIIVPTYQPQYDTLALKTWAEAMPGYQIEPINCNSIIGASGALHCITKEVATADPLLISYKKLENLTENNPQGYTLQSTIKHRSGIESAYIYYKTASTATQYDSVAMISMSSIQHEWLGQIPYLPNADTVFYYVGATANSGKTQVKPMVAPVGYYYFLIGTVSGVATMDAPDFQPIFPNPAKAITCIPIHTAKPVEASLRLYNALGQLQQDIFTGMLPAGPSKYFFHAANFTPGTYWVELRTKGQVRTQKVLIH